MTTMTKLRLSIAACLTAILSFGALSISDKGVLPGEWSKDFDSALKLSRERNHPLLVICGGKGCAFCQRLNKAMGSADFLDWQKDRKVFMVHLNDTDKEYKAARDFVREGAKNVSASPLVCVYWPKPSGEEVRSTFSGRRGMMPSPKNKFLHIELINALDGVLADYIASTPGHGELRLDPLRGAKKISFGVAGGAGHVAMQPANGLLPDDNSIVRLLATNVSPESVFALWRDPRGKAVAFTRQLEVSSGMPEGTYVAEYKAVPACAPPDFTVPTTPIWAKAGTRLNHQVDIADSRRPVSFRAQGLPFGISIHPGTGFISGVAWKPGTNRVSVTATSPNPRHAPVTKSFMLIVRPRK